MRLKMGLYWCEVFIDGSLAKPLLGKLAPLGVGIAVTSSMSVLVFHNHPADAVSCCKNANESAPTVLPEASEKVKDSTKAFKKLAGKRGSGGVGEQGTGGAGETTDASPSGKAFQKITGCLEQSSLKIPTLSFENARLDALEEGFSTLGKPLFSPFGALGGNEKEQAFDVSRITNLQWSSDSLLLVNDLPTLEGGSASCLTQKGTEQSTPEAELHAQISLPLSVVEGTRGENMKEKQEVKFASVAPVFPAFELSQQNPTGDELGKTPHPNSVSKEASVLLETTETLNQNSILSIEEGVSIESPSTSKLVTAESRSVTPRRLLQAQTTRPNPNEDRFLQPSPTPIPIPSEDEPTVQPSPTRETQPSQPETPTQPSSAEQTIQVKSINVTGSSVFGPEQLNPIVQSYEGRALTLEQLREAADRITQLYLDRGYITSRAILVDQEISPEGVVEIRVIEGSLEEIRIEGTRRLKPSYVRNRVRLGAGKPLNTGKLEDQLRLLRADPLFENVEASLRAGTGVGQSILIVRVAEADPFEGSVGIDNYSPPSVGSERLGLNLLYRNLTGNGDEIAASYYHTTTSGADTFDFSYRIPLNAMNGTLQLRAAPSRNNITQPPLSALGIKGQSELYEISYRQPFIRSPREEFALSLGFTYQEGQTFLFESPFPFGIGPEADGSSSTRVIKFGQDYLRRDVRGAWSLRSLFSFGVDVFGATTNPEPIPDGRFVSWLGQIQRVQILNQDNFLIIGADIQLTPNSLLPSQQFVIGGGQSLRGYRQNIRSGDNGVRFSVEDRITLQRNEAGASTFQLAPFFDAGVVWNKSDNPNNEFLPSQRFLAGIGLGLIWEIQPGLSMRLDYGYPLIKIDDKGTNAQDQGFYFSVRYQF